MTFNFEIIEIDNALKVILSGRLDSNTSNLLEKNLLSLFEASGRSVLIDFSALDYISSAGLRVIIMAAKKAKDEKGKLMLFNMRPNVRSVFEISGLLMILEVVENQDQALALLEY